MSTTVIRGAHVITMDATTGATPVRRDLRIVDGRFAEISTEIIPRDGDEVIDGAGMLVTPGFVNAHTHSWEYLYKGRYDNLPLELWMLYSYPILGGARLDPDIITLRTLMFAMESMKNGVTTLIDDVLETPGQDLDQLAAVADAYEAIGIRANVSGHIINRPFVDTLPFVADRLPAELVQEVRRQPTLSAQEYLDYSRTAFAEHHGAGDGRIRYMLAPSGPQRVTDDLLVGANALAAEFDAEVHIHVLETKMQAVTGDELYGGRTLVQHLDEIGALSRRTTFAHGIWVTDEDIERIARAEVSVSHNAISNLKLGSGVLPWRRYHDAGVNLGLGTDGCSSSDTPRLMEVMKTAALLHKVTEPDYERWPTVPEVLHAATLGGARSGVLDGSVGSIEVGKQADLVMFDTETLAFLPTNRLENHLVYSENGSSIVRVMVDGVVTVENGRLTQIDEDAVIAAFRAVMPRIREEQDRLDAVNAAFAPVFAGAYRESAARPLSINRWIGSESEWVRELV
ncbi:amidohydrolase family protein [Microbacterium sp. zg.Y909]|uniref:amidohydrolase family protein n=1 Tax=Microbacterium sp. zg.Y909 TaxID=2969413 RepID=UPI00214AE1B5|nr:amidohydrolase family protein [Microbacterium sp. zg.Y909]MCR2826681.1 amidohydrolase family protein [Microbacterium sp. zg.Y909]